MTVSEQNACSGKVRFDSRKEAKQARRRMIGRGLAKTATSRLQAYQCPFCDWYHLGHISPSVSRGVLDKDDWVGR